MKSFIIREYQNKDWAQVLEMIRQTMNFHMSIQDPIRFESYTSKLLRNFLLSLTQNHRLKKANLLVAVHENELAGFIYGKIDHHDQEMQKSAVSSGTIDELFVLPNFRNKGVTQQLMQHMENYFKEHQCKLIRLKDVHVSNMTARTFYKKLDYKERVIEYAKRIN